MTNLTTTEIKALLAPVVSEIVARLATLGIADDGTGDLGIIVRQALTDDPRATAEDIAEIVREARADARAEAAEIASF